MPRFLRTFWLTLLCVCTFTFAYAHTAQAQVDLRITTIQAPTGGGSVSATQSFGASVTVQNVGNIFLFSPYELHYFYCPTAQVTAQCIYLTKQNVTHPLGQNQSRTYTQNLTFPLQAQPGTGYLRVWVDGSNVVQESNEKNNNAFRAIRITSLPRPDLVVTQSKAPIGVTQVASGGSVQVEFSLQNQGAAFTQNFAIGFSFCTTQNAAQCTQRSTMNITDNWVQGQTRTYKHTLTIPSVSSGTYYIRIFADSTYQVPEFMELNNARFEDIPVYLPTRPDLTVTHAVAGAGVQYVAPNNEVKIQYTLHNKGAPITKNFRVQIYYCSTSQSSSCTQFVTSFFLRDRLARGQKKTYSSAFNLPSNAVPGTRWIQVFADGGKSIVEEDENNNTLQTRVQIRQPDLTVSAAKIPTVGQYIAQGQSFRGEYTIKNGANGGLISRKFELSLYQCPQRNPTGCVQFATVTIHNGVNARPFGTNATRTYPFTSRFPKLLPLQNKQHYIRITVDSKREIQESNETNNDRYVQVSLRPIDLSIPTVQSPQAATSIIQGQHTSVQLDIQNASQSGPLSEPFEIRLQYCPKAQPIGCQLSSLNKVLQALSSGQKYNYKTSLRIPQQAQVGTGYIQVMLDPSRKLPELNRTNNVRYIPLKILPVPRPDLQVSTLLVTPSKGLPEASLNVRYVLKNLGSANAAPAKVRFYYSTDSTITTSDTYLQVERTHTLSKGARYPSTGMASVTLKLPKSLPIGKGYIGAIVDFDQRVQESNETNNTQTTPFTIEAPIPDLVALRVASTPNPTLSGRTIKVHYEVENKGTSEVKGYSIRFYFSSDKQVDSTDTVWMTFTESRTLQARKQHTGSLNITVPKATPARSGWLLMFVDWNQKHTEKDERNNLQSAACTVLRPQPEPQIEPTPEPSVEPIADAGPGIDTSPDRPREDCYTRGCPKDQICIQGVCTTDLCVQTQCAAQEFCRLGKCVPVCACGQCSTREMCVDGQCIPDLCSGKKCARGEYCQPSDGMCKTDPCTRIRCGSGRVCDSTKGACIDDPCSGVQCPQGSTCSKGQCIEQNCGRETHDERPTEPQDASTEKTPETIDSIQEQISTEPDLTNEKRSKPEPSKEQDIRETAITQDTHTDTSTPPEIYVGPGCCTIGKEPSAPYGWILLFGLLCVIRFSQKTSKT